MAQGASVDLRITIESDGPIGEQQFGEIRLVPRNSANPTLHLPVAFVPHPGRRDVDADVRATTRSARISTTTCTVTAQNNAFESTTVDLRSRVNHHLEITAADGADVTDGGRGAELLGEELSAADGRHPVDRTRSVARWLSPAG